MPFGRPEHQIDTFRTELSSADLTDDGEGSSGGNSPAVGAIFNQGLEGIGYRGHSCQQGNLQALEPGWIPTTVESFVMVHGNSDQVFITCHCPHDAGTDRRVESESLSFDRREVTLLLKQLDPQGEFSNVVKLPAQDSLLDVERVYPAGSKHGTEEPAYGIRMKPGQLVAGLEKGTQLETEEANCRRRQKTQRPIGPRVVVSAQHRQLSQHRQSCPQVRFGQQLRAWV